MADNNALRVEAVDIERKAHEILSLLYPTKPQDPKPADDTSTVAGYAATKLKENAEILKARLWSGDTEGRRLGQTLRAAAKAFDRMDELAAEAFDKGETSVESPVLAQVEPPLQAPPPSESSSKQATYLYTDPLVNAIHLEKSDRGSLETFAQEWNAYGDKLQEMSAVYTPVSSWEGAAGEAAEAALRKHADWLGEMAQKCRDLAKQANTLWRVHDAAVNAHPTSAYLTTLTETILHSDDGNAIQAAHDNWTEAQRKSEEVMISYAVDAYVDLLKPEPPPSGAANIPPVTRRWGGKNGGGGAPGGGGGTPPGGALQPGAGPADGQPQPQGGQQSGGDQKGGGQPSGGSPSGGSPAGGGEPKGGATPSLPDPSTGLPMTDEPGLHKASAGGGSGGGGGGGIPPMPLQPNVGSVSVGPGPASGGTPGGAVPAGAPGGGMGGMGGGGAPMGGGHGQGGGGKEKRRTPGLSPDEELYTEDREWTEGYIGKPQRKPGMPPKDRRED